MVKDLKVSVWMRIKQYVVQKSDKSFNCPIFIISPPRSGSTLLFESMFNFNELYHFDHESDFIWWASFPYEEMDSPSDYIPQEKATPETIEIVRNYYYKSLIHKYSLENDKASNERYSYEKHQLRLLDKTIANCFHLGFLEKAFPTAYYIFLVRDPRSTISSMIEGWPYLDRFGKVQLTPELRKCDNATIDHWTYPAPPGWQKIVCNPLEQICAWSWQQHVIFMQKQMSVLNYDRFMFVKYEDILEQPIEIYKDIAAKFSLNLTEKHLNIFTKPKLSGTTVSPPRKDKWKDTNYDRIMSILPDIRSTASSIGYSL